MTAAPIDQRSANGTLMRQGDQYIKSDEKAQNRYGQNGYGGPSSDLPGKNTSTGFLPKVEVNKDLDKAGDWQTRRVDSSAYATTHGMKSRASDEKVPNKVSYAK